MKNLKKLLFGFEPALFRMVSSPEEAVRRLSDRVKPTVFHTFFTQALVGKVTMDGVHLCRHQPLWNKNGPHFHGKFVIRNGVTHLEGEFSMPWLIKVFFILWFTGLLGIGLFLIISFLRGQISEDPSKLILFIGALLGMGAGGTLILVVGNLFGRGDIIYISEVIQECGGTRVK